MKGQIAIFRLNGTLNPLSLKYFVTYFSCANFDIATKFSFRASKENRGHRVKWMEKAFQACLNRLFKIDFNEHNFFVLLTKKNSRSIMSHLTPFLLPVFSCIVLASSIPREHYFIKDL